MIIASQPMQTSLDVLLLSPHLCPPLNTLYGARSNGFVLSRIHRFNGKLWQLRSVCVHGREYRVLPFVINTGGSSWDTPILGDPALALLGIGRDDAGVLDRAHDDVVELPNPVGRIRHPLSVEWDRQRTEKGLLSGTYDVRMNLVGHELAAAIVLADGHARDVQAGRVSRQTAIACLASAFEDLGSSIDAATREIDALLVAPTADRGLWTGESLPLADGAL